jgi:O-Antigen ligase
MNISVTAAPITGAPTPRRVIVAGMTLAVSLALSIVLAREAPPSPPLVAVAGLAGIAIVGLVLVRYEAAIALGLLLLAVVRFQPAPTDAVFAVVIGVAALSGRLHLRRVPSVVLGLLAALLVLNVVSVINSVSVGTAVSFFSITLYLVLFAVWLAGYVDSRRRSKQVVVWYLAAALISAALGLVAILAPIPGRSTLLFAGRAKALFKDPNVFGPFLIPALLILLEDTVTPRLLATPRRLKLAGVILLGLGVLFSYSRAAWLNLGVALVVLLAVQLLRRRSARASTRLLAVLFAAVVTGAAAIAVTGSGSFLQERAALQGYDASRFSAQEAGIRLGEHHPIGIGPGQVDVILPLSTHNLYVRVFAEQGPLGLLLLLALLLGTLGFAARNAVRGRDTYGIGSAALLAAWCGLLVNSAVIDTLHWRHLWIVAALIWAGAARGAPSSGSFGAAASSGSARGAMPAGTPRRALSSGVVGGAA